MRMKQLNYWPKYWGVFGDMNKNRDAPPPYIMVEPKPRKRAGFRLSTPANQFGINGDIVRSTENTCLRSGYPPPKRAAKRRSNSSGSSSCNKSQPKCITLSFSIKSSSGGSSSETLPRQAHQAIPRVCCPCPAWASEAKMKR